MAKFVELLDAGVRIAARFHSHCPQTARMYYHPPSNAEDHRLYQATGCGDQKLGGQHSTDMISTSCGMNAAMGSNTSEFILYTVV